MPPDQPHKVVRNLLALLVSFYWCLLMCCRLVWPARTTEVSFISIFQASRAKTDRGRQRRIDDSLKRSVCLVQKVGTMWIAPSPHSPFSFHYRTGQSNGGGTNANKIASPAAHPKVHPEATRGAGQACCRPPGTGCIWTTSTGWLSASCTISSRSASANATGIQLASSSLVAAAVDAAFATVTPKRWIYAATDPVTISWLSNSNANRALSICSLAIASDILPHLLRTRCTTESSTRPAIWGTTAANVHARRTTISWRYGCSEKHSFARGFCSSHLRWQGQCQLFISHKWCSRCSSRDRCRRCT